METLRALDLTLRCKAEDKARDHSSLEQCETERGGMQPIGQDVQDVAMDAQSTRCAKHAESTYLWHAEEQLNMRANDQQAT